MYNIMTQNGVAAEGDKEEQRVHAFGVEGPVFNAEAYVKRVTLDFGNVATFEEASVLYDLMMIRLLGPEEAR
jgi:hypothetical protein